MENGVRVRNSGEKETRNVKVDLRSGSSSDTVAKYLRLLASRSPESVPPLYSWIELDPTDVRPERKAHERPGQTLLKPGGPDLSDGTIRIAEARLFWEHCALHVVATDGGCRWVELAESEPEGASDTTVERILLLWDDKGWHRFGLDPTGSLIRQVKILEYRRGGDTIGWRLVPVKPLNPRG